MSVLGFEKSPKVLVVGGVVIIVIVGWRRIGVAVGKVEAPILSDGGTGQLGAGLFDGYVEQN